MSVYRCYFLNKIGSDSGWATIYCDNDQNARLRTLELLRDRPRVYAVEVWHDTRLAFRHRRETEKLFY